MTSIRATMAQAMNTWSVPGTAMCVVHNGNTLLSEGFGLSDIARNSETTRETVFWIASNTKAITSFSLALLVDEGLLDWDAPIRTYLPSLRMATTELTEGVTVRDLLSHRTGLAGNDEWGLRNPQLTRADLFDRLRYHEPNAPIRTRYQYNNLMFTIAGHVAETIAGIQWETFVADRIFAPLGITTFDFNYINPENHPDVSESYVSGTPEAHAIPKPVARKPDVWAPSPAGGINTNIIEMEKWLRLHLDGGVAGSKRIISEERLREMYAPHMPVSDTGQFPEHTFSCSGLGWHVSYYRGLKKISHGGALGSYVALIPEKSLGIAVLTNMATPLSQAVAATAIDNLLGFASTPWVDRFREQQLRQQEAAQPPKTGPVRIDNTAPTASPEQLAGTYTNESAGEMTVTVRGSESTAILFGYEVPLRHYHYDTYVANFPYPTMEMFITFRRNHTGDIHGFDASSPMGRDKTFVKT